MPTEWEMCEKDATVSIKYKDANVGSNEMIIPKDLSDDPDYDAVSRG